MHSCGCVQCANICWPIDLKSELGGAESVYAQTVLCLFQPKTLSCMAYSVAELHHKVQALSKMSCTLCSQGLWDFRFLLAQASPKDIIPCKAGNECSHHCYAPPPQVGIMVTYSAAGASAGHSHLTALPLGSIGSPASSARGHRPLGFRVRAGRPGSRAWQGGRGGSGRGHPSGGGLVPGDGRGRRREGTAPDRRVDGMSPASPPGLRRRLRAVR